MFRRNRPKPIYAPKVRVSKGEVLSVWERYFERGLHQFGQGNLEDALEDIEAAIDINNRDGELHVTRGLILLEMSKVDDAMEALNEGLKLDQRQWLAHYLFGLHAYRRKQIDEAIGHLATAKTYAPTRPEVLYLLSMCYYARGEIERALDHVDSAIENADNPRAKPIREMKKFQKQVKRDVKAQKSK